MAVWESDPSALTRLPLGAFDLASPAEVAVRRLLLVLRVSPRLLWFVVGRTRGIAGVQRLLVAYCYWRGVRSAVRDDDTWRRLTRGTTILMYHAFGGDAEPASRFVVPVQSFRRQMDWLARKRPVLSLEQLVACRNEHRLPPAGAVVVTIDDAYDDVRLLALPILRRLGIPATLFVPTALLGGVNLWNTDPPLQGRPLISADAARDLPAEGLALGAHTRTHPILTELAEATLDAEVFGSRADLEELLGASVQTFAYPFGRWNDRVADVTRRAGFACGVTVRAGRNCAATPSYGLRRTEIWGTDSLLRFAVAIGFGDRRAASALFRRAIHRSRA